MRYEVYLTEDAVHDLEDLYSYIARHDSLSRAEHVLQRIEGVIDALSKYPKRGAYPKELVALGIREYRETFFKPYRVIYRINGTQVFIYLIADGRRDMQTLLQNRLLKT